MKKRIIETHYGIDTDKDIISNTLNGIDTNRDKVDIVVDEQSLIDMLFSNFIAVVLDK